VEFESAFGKTRNLGALFRNRADDLSCFLLQVGGVALKSKLERARIQAGRRCRQIRDLWQLEGLAGIAKHTRRFAAERLAPKSVVMPVNRADVIAADLSRQFPSVIPEIISGEPLLINWVTSSPSAGSGGHTTLFRILRYLEEHGYRNRVYLYEVYGGDHNYYRSIIRDYYGFHGPVRKVDDGMEDAHIVFATGWPSAYPVFNSSCAGKRFYFVQDFEPYFHAVGSLSALAENTYRMGFHAITAGKWLAVRLREEFGMPADSFDFGCDTAAYYHMHDVKRSGIVFYARPEADRRGFEIGLMAMEIFAARHPEIDLHFYGDKIDGLPFRFFNHGRIKPEQLNDIYNRCYGGLSLSLTNVSLVPHEMLAAGCIPVVNEAVQNRIVLNNPFVRYAQLYPHALAAELEAVVAARDFNSISQAAAQSVSRTTWEDAGATVDRVLRRALQEGIHTLAERPLRREIRDAHDEAVAL